MLIRDLINKLEEIYKAEKESDTLGLMGEPEIMIDVFDEVDEVTHTFHYAGISDTITIDRTADGVYLVFNAFGQPRDAQAYPAKSPG